MSENTLQIGSLAEKLQTTLADIITSVTKQNETYRETDDRRQSTESIKTGPD